MSGSPTENDGGLSYEECTEEYRKKIKAQTEKQMKTIETKEKGRKGVIIARYIIENELPEVVDEVFSEIVNHRLGEVGIPWSMLLDKKQEEENVEDV